MGAHVIWFGPVSREQRNGATVRGAEEHFVSCTGDGAGGSKRCRALAEALVDSDGRHLPGLLRQLGIAAGEELYLGAFSAGGSAVKILLAHPEDRAAVRAVMLADATYELSGADGRAASSPSLVAYALEALADGSRMFLATASGSPNVRLGTTEPSGAQTLERIATDIEAQWGQRFDQTSFIEGINDLHPARVWSRGSVILADFATTFSHAEHATELAPSLWPRVLQPWLDASLDRFSARFATSGPSEAPAASPDISHDGSHEGSHDEGPGPVQALLAVGAVTLVIAGVGAVFLRPQHGDERRRRAQEEERMRRMIAAARR